MAERLADVAACWRWGPGWEVLLTWPDGHECVAETFSTEAKAVEECDKRNCRYRSARHKWVYRYRLGWIGGEVLIV